MVEKILVVSPHGDDAELGLGGVLNKFKGKEIKHIVFDKQFKIRDFHLHRQEILDQLIEARDDFKPDTVFVPSRTDYHQDHIIVTNEAIRAFKKSASILGYELPWNNLETRSGLLVKLSKADVEAKWEMLQQFPAQFHSNYFNKEFIFSLAKVRGIQCDADFAESFEVIRWLIS